jgi:hypothetical protein
MAVKNRPGFKTNVDRTVKGTARKTVFFDIKPGTTVLLRFTPTSNEDGQLFFESCQHFKFLEDGEKRAFACLEMHGVDDTVCPICDALERAPEVLGKNAAKSLIKDHGSSNRWHAQIIPIRPEGVEAAEQSYIVGLSKTTAGKVSKILKLERDTRQVLLTDPDEGQAIQIERNSATGFNTRYEVLASNVRVPLDTLLPGWDEKFLNVEKSLKLRIEDRETLLASMKETFGDVQFNALFPDGK